MNAPIFDFKGPLRRYRARKAQRALDRLYDGAVCDNCFPSDPNNPENSQTLHCLRDPGHIGWCGGWYNDDTLEPVSQEQAELFQERQRKFRAARGRLWDIITDAEIPRTRKQIAAYLARCPSCGLADNGPPGPGARRCAGCDCRWGMR